MPQITRQKTTGDNGQRTQRVVRSDSLLARAVPSSELKVDQMQLLLWGKNRVGKTTLACQFEKPLLLVCNDFKNNGGADPVIKMPGVKVLRQGVELDGSADVERVGAELAAGQGEWRTVVVDGLQSLEAILLAEIMGWPRPAEMLRYPKKGESPKVSQDQYTERSEKIRECLRAFVDLRGCNVIYTATEKDHNPPKEGDGVRRPAWVRGPMSESVFGPSVGSGACRWLSDSTKWTCQLYQDKELKETETVLRAGKEVIKSKEWVETGRITWKLRMRLHPNFLAGISVPGLDVPEWVQASTPQEMHDTIVKVSRGQKVPNGFYPS